MSYAMTENNMAISSISNLPVCFYHPLTILFVDDDENFLKTIELELSKKFNIKVCVDEQKAITMLFARGENIKLINKLDYEHDDFSSSQFLNIDINALHSLVEIESRFNLIGVVVVDYQMPHMTGIEFLREIKAINIKKIMLTAEADKDLAIEAFNEQLLDKFLFKNDKRLGEKLINIIEELTCSYFNHISQIVFDSLDQSVKHLLKSDQFKQLFSKVYSKTNAIEFYLIDKFGSFVFLDKNGIKSCLIILPSHEQHNIANMVEDLGGPKSMVDNLRAGKKILYLHNNEIRRKPVIEWKNYLYDADLLNFDNYYSVVYNCADFISIENNKVV